MTSARSEASRNSASSETRGDTGSVNAVMALGGDLWNHEQVVEQLVDLVSALFASPNWPSAPPCERTVCMSVFDAEYVPSPWQPVADQVALFESTHGAQGNEIMGGPCIILTSIGAKTRKVRKTPLIRVEKDGRYVVIGSLGGAPTHPNWVHNLRTHPRARIQDGPTVHELAVRELDGDEKRQWWSHATATWPDYDKYQEATDRVIPLFLLEP